MFFLERVSAKCIAPAPSRNGWKIGKTKEKSITHFGKVYSRFSDKSLIFA
jgi:hypothetical protein